jgi:hypothetical protein
VDASNLRRVELHEVADCEEEEDGRERHVRVTRSRGDEARRR